jgi:hypothetical protein
LRQYQDSICRRCPLNSFMSAAVHTVITIDTARNIWLPCLYFYRAASLREALSGLLARSKCQRQAWSENGRICVRRSEAGKLAEEERFELSSYPSVTLCGTFLHLFKLLICLPKVQISATWCHRGVRAVLGQLTTELTIFTGQNFQLLSVSSGPKKQLRFNAKHFSLSLESCFPRHAYVHMVDQRPSPLRQ